MSKVTFEVEPQRPDASRAYVTVEIHKATSFAVIRRESFISKGRPYVTSRVIGRYATKTEADGMAELNRKNYAPRPVLKLGQRMPKKEKQ